MRRRTPPPGLVASYNHSLAWLGQIDQPMLAVAAHYQALAQHDAGNADRVKLDLTAAHLPSQVAAEPEGARGSLSTTVQLAGHKTQVTVSQSTTDPTGGAQFHDIDATDIGALVEKVVGVVADVLSFVPGVDAVAIPVAIAVAAAEGAQDLASGDILGGVLALAGAAAGGAGTWANGVLGAAAEAGSTASAATLSLAGDVAAGARYVSEGVAAAQGLRGAIGAAERGDGLAVLTSLAGGVAGSVGGGTGWGRELPVCSDWMGALVL